VRGGGGQSEWGQSMGVRAGGSEQGGQRGIWLEAVTNSTLGVTHCFFCGQESRSDSGVLLLMLKSLNSWSSKN